jgi:hypothetical protein
MFGIERRFEKKKAVREAERIIGGYYDRKETVDEVSALVKTQMEEWVDSCQAGMKMLSETNPLDKRIGFLVPEYVAESVSRILDAYLRRFSWKKEYSIEESLGASLVSIFNVGPNEDGNVDISISTREMNEINVRLKKANFELEPATLVLNENFAAANDGLYARHYALKPTPATPQNPRGW